jgi:hypothetical protein
MILAILFTMKPIEYLTPAFNFLIKKRIIKIDQVLTNHKLPEGVRLGAARCGSNTRTAKNH